MGFRRGEPRAKQQRRTRLATEPAGCPHFESRLSRGAQNGKETQVVESRQSRVAVGAGEGNLEFPWQVPGVLFADQAISQGIYPGADVERLLGVVAGLWRAQDVAHRVAAAPARREADSGEIAQQGRNLSDGHVVDLDVLPGREMQERAAVAVGEIGELSELGRRHSACGAANAVHERARGTLLVDSERHTSGLENAGIELARLELPDGGLQVVDLGQKCFRIGVGHGIRPSEVWIQSRS